MPANHFCKFIQSLKEVTIGWTCQTELATLILAIIWRAHIKVYVNKPCVMHGQCDTRLMFTFSAVEHCHCINGLRKRDKHPIYAPISTNYP